MTSYIYIIGGALLGDQTISTVTIAKSDYPNGNFGFNSKLMVTLDNPPSLITTLLSVGRTGGLTGQQTVSSKYSSVIIVFYSDCVW